MEPPAASGTSFTILSVSIVGILATSLLLLAYYLFLTKCGIASWGRRYDDHATAPHRVVIVSAPGPVHRGLEEPAIRRIPTFRYQKPCHAQVASECAVCLSEFQAGERLRLLPPCLHAFHIDCIDAWLQATANCPLCRAALSASDCHDQLDVATVLRAVDGAAETAASVVIDVVSEEDVGERKCSGMGVGDEGIGGESRRRFEPMRRSLSMDSCGDKHVYLTLQKVLQQRGGESSTTAGRLRRPFFSFSQGRSVILPV